MNPKLWLAGHMSQFQEGEVNIRNKVEGMKKNEKNQASERKR